LRSQSFGSLEGLAVVDLPDPSPADGQVLIATEAIGVGGVDAIIRSGALAAYGFTEGHILGAEIAGTIAAVVDGVDTSWIGQRVWAFTGLGGGYAEQAIVPAEALVPSRRPYRPPTRSRSGAPERWPGSAFARPASLPASQCWCVARPAASGS
jgi:NADPH:quinone reductase-like Zn-dependent oxidoreductase